MNFKITFYASAISCLIFGAFSQLFHFGDWNRLICFMAFGLFIGVIAAPELEPRKFKYGWLVQISAGFIAGVIASLFFALTAEEIIACGFIGGFVGWLAPLWINHIQIP